MEERMATGIKGYERVYALRHIETQEFICLLPPSHTIDYLVCFSDGDGALEFRADYGLQEYVDLVPTTVNDSPFSHFWLDGEYRVTERVH